MNNIVPYLVTQDKIFLLPACHYDFQVRVLLAEFIDIALHFIPHTMQHTTPYSRFGIVAKERFFTIFINERKTCRLLVKHLEAHRRTGRNVPAVIATVGIDKVVGYASTGIDDEHILAWKQLVGTCHGGKAVATQCPGRAVKVYERHRCLSCNMQHSAIQSPEHCLYVLRMVCHRREGTGNGLYILKKRLKRSEVVASEVYSLLQLVPFEYCGLGKRVTDVNYQIHFSGAKLLIELEFAKPNVF